MSTPTGSTAVGHGFSGGNKGGRRGLDKPLQHHSYQQPPPNFRLEQPLPTACAYAKLNPPARRAMRSRRGCSSLQMRLLCVALTAASAQNTLKLPVEVDQSGAASSNAPRPRWGGAGSRRPRGLPPLGLRIGDAGPCDVCLRGAAERRRLAHRPFIPTAQAARRSTS